MIELAWLLLALADAYRHYGITKTERPDYLQAFIIRGMFAIGVGVAADVKYDVFHKAWEMNSAELLVAWLPLLTFQCFSFVLVFNTFLNKLRNKKFDYIGSKSGWIESNLSKLKGKFDIERMYFFFILLGTIVSWVWFRIELMK